MNRQLVRSSNIRSIGYDQEKLILEIEFHSGGIYQYFEVPETIFNELMRAASHGSYFHRYIKNRYRYSKIQ